MKYPRELKITADNLKHILGEEYEKYFNDLIRNCFCSKCSRTKESKITDYEIFINDINDVVLRGFCDQCGGAVSRYLETGEKEESKKRVREIMKKYVN